MGENPGERLRSRLHLALEVHERIKVNANQRPMEGGPGMTDPTSEFFDELGQRGHEPLLQKAKGSVRFEIMHGAKIDRWLVTIDKGDIAVSRRNAAADCLIRADRALFDRLACGELNTFAAVIRGELALEGDLRFLVLVQRLFPGPPGSRKKTRSARAARRQR